MNPLENQEKLSMNMKGAFIALAAVGALATGAFTIGGFHSVDNSEYQVVKTFNGNTSIKATPGWYVNYGTEDTYRFLGSLDFAAGADDTATRDRKGYAVKYNDAEGVVEGTLYVDFPDDQINRMKIHSKYGSQAAAMSMVDKAMGEAFNLTAGLMKSQEAYMTHRAIFRQYALDQLKNGLYQTYVETTETVSKDGTVTTESVTKIAYEKDAEGNSTGIPMRSAKSTLANYGISVSDFSLTYMGFDEKTEVQIDKRRDAENAVLISKANAEKAAQETIEQEQIALKNKAITEGKAKEEASRQIVEANRDKELAEIDAQMKVSVAKELEQQRKNELAAAKLESQSITVLSTAQAAAKDRLIKSGGQLSAAQQTEIAINEAWAEAYAKKAVPQYNVGDAAMGDSSMDSTQSAMQTLSLKAATELVNKQ